MLLLFPQTPAGAVLRRLLVEAPARALSRLRRGHFALLIMLVALGVIAASFGRELLLVFAQGTPELVAWFAAFDIATYVDVIAAAVIVAAAVRLKAALAFARMALRRILPRRSASAGPRRPRLKRRRTPPADPQDEPWPAGLALA